MTSKNVASTLNIHHPLVISPSKQEAKAIPHTGLDRPLELQDVEAPRISRQSAHEGGMVVSPA